MLRDGDCDCLWDECCFICCDGECCADYYPEWGSSEECPGCGEDDEDEEDD
jgi:hypothetical protein